VAIINDEALKDRGGELDAAGLNGIKLILVDHLDTSASPPAAYLRLHFYNSQWLGDIETGFDPGDEDKRKIFTISGGFRVPAGWGRGEVHVAAAAVNSSDNTILDLIVSPIGDYSTYSLTVDYKVGDEQKIDPVLNTIGFKFRPGCFNIDCAPAGKTAPPPGKEPKIDYLAKDYDSFKHTLINAMMERVPGWQATSEADLDQVLIDLFSAAADELSDYQDRVMNEAYLGTARKRVSIARHARLMDYHIHQGNQACTWLALELKTNPGLVAGIDLAPGFIVWSGKNSDNVFKPSPSSVVFMTREHQFLHYLLNSMSLYTWDDSIPALKAGSVSADLKIGNGNEGDAKQVESFIREGKITHLLIYEKLNPATGRSAGFDPDKRQVLNLLPGTQGALAMKDPKAAAGKEWLVRVNWQVSDKLKHNYCFTVDCNGEKTRDVSLFSGNLVRAYHGQPVSIVFKAPSETLGSGEYYYTPTEKWGTLCRLPEKYGPLAYLNTLPGGEVKPKSTLEVKVEVDGTPDPWDEVISLVQSGSGAERGDHFMVETDEQGRSVLRFGNGTIGKELPENAVVHCSYQAGQGLDGNIGADTLIYYDNTTSPWDEITAVCNPFDVTEGRAPEPVAEILRRVPEAFRARQLRAVTLEDYEDRAEEVSGVAKASARYAWTGSWRTVRVTIDPRGTSALSRGLKEKVARHLEAVRLIGEDIEIRPPRWVPLVIEVDVCVHPHYWPEDIKYALEMEFTEGYLPDGRTGFFHPDNWTFGQSLHASRIIGRIQQVEGVDHVKKVTMKRFNQPDIVSEEIIKVKANEIIRVRDNPDAMEEGSVTFFVEGGRR
jgi:hypothetical protein